MRCVGCIREVLDMCENNISRFAIVYVVLSPADSSYVRGNTAINYNVFFPGIFVHGDAADDFEAVTIVDVVGNGS